MIVLAPVASVAVAAASNRVAGSLQQRCRRADVLRVLFDPHTPAAVLAHCPHCRGAVRPGAPWCTQCWTDLRPPPSPEPVAVPAEPSPTETPTETSTAASPGPAPAAADGVRQPGAVALAVDRPAPSWPCAACGADNRFELAECGGCGAPFLAQLRADGVPVVVLPVVGDVMRLNKAQRYGLAGVVALLAVLLVALVGVLLS